MNKFWNFTEEGEVRTLHLCGSIADESWFDDDVTPKAFRAELEAGKGDIVVWINSPGGDCVAAAQIYNMLMDYPGNVTVKVDGIAASEASNNAATGGAMVPLLSLGIPGGNAAAVMMSALTLKGVQLGPLLLTNQPEYLSATFASMIVTNILMVIVAIGIAKVFAQILAIPYSYLGPIIVMLAIIGSYANQMSIADVQIMVLAGVLGVVIKACHFNSAAIVLGLVLGTMFEREVRMALYSSHGDWMIFFQRPVAAAFILLSLFFMGNSLWKAAKEIRKEKAAGKNV